MTTKPLSRIIYFCLGTTLLFGCSGPASIWHLDSIATGDTSFDSSRLFYQDPASHSRLRLEFIRVAGEIDLFLSLSQYSLTPSPSDPSSILVQFSIEGEPPFQESIALHEGKMRLRIPPQIRDRIASALQEGKKVGILVDDFEETLNPDQFTQIFEQFSGSSFRFQNFFKGMY